MIVEWSFISVFNHIEMHAKGPFRFGFVING